MSNNARNTGQYPFMVWAWDMEDWKTIPETNIIDVIYYAWSYEYSIYEKDTRELIFDPLLDNDWNNYMLEKYDVELVNDNGKRKIRDKITGIVHTASWQKESE